MIQNVYADHYQEFSENTERLHRFSYNLESGVKVNSEAAIAEMILTD
jgi:hypothetical protein